MIEDNCKERRLISQRHFKMINFELFCLTKSFIESQRHIYLRILFIKGELNKYTIFNNNRGKIEDIRKNSYLFYMNKIALNVIKKFKL